MKLIKYIVFSIISSSMFIFCDSSNDADVTADDDDISVDQCEEGFEGSSSWCGTVGEVYCFNLSNQQRVYYDLKVGDDYCVDFGSEDETCTHLYNEYPSPYYLLVSTQNVGDDEVTFSVEFIRPEAGDAICSGNVELDFTATITYGASMGSFSLLNSPISPPDYPANTENPRSCLGLKKFSGYLDQSVDLFIDELSVWVSSDCLVQLDGGCTDPSWCDELATMTTIYANLPLFKRIQGI